MPLVNRATLPEEFFDITSAQLLVEPEPQYLHCKLAKMALAASFDADAALGFMPDRSFGGSGPPYATAESGRLVLSDGLYDQAVTAVSELGNAPGHTVRLNRPRFANTTYTQAVREVPSGTAISVVPVSVLSSQIPVTVKRFAGPYDAANTRVAPIGVDRFDGSMMLHKPAQVAGLTLKRDFDRTIDSFMVTLADAAVAGNIIRPNGMVNDNSSVVAGDFPFSFSLLQRMETALDTANVPVFPNGKRMGVLTPRQCEQLGADAQFNRQSVFEKDFNPLFRGTYWKSCGQWDLFKSTTLSVVANATPVNIHYGQALAPGCLGLGQGELPRTAYNTQDNYGETALVIWLWYLGLVTLDDRFLGRWTTS
jgi:hypothetical protein